MPFNIWTDGLRSADYFARLLNTHYINRDPLSGVVDGTNTIFYSTYSPILSSGSVEVRVGPNTTTAYTLSHEEGAFIFTTAPNLQPVATYTMSRYPDRVIRGVLVAGFDEMETRWPRGLTLSEVIDVNHITPISDTSPAAYVVNSSGSDPVIKTGPLGDITFGLSRAQVGFYVKCVQYSWLLIQLGEHAMTDFLYREAQGATIDKSGIPRNIELAKRNLKEDLVRAQEAAQVEQLGTDIYGAALVGPLTREYISQRFWESLSKSQDWRATTRYRGQMW